MATKHGNLSISSENIFPIIKKWLYSDKDIFLREIVANGVEAFIQAYQNEYEAIIHIPMSSGLSKSCETAQMLSEYDEYKGKVFVVDNKRISVTQKASVFQAMELAKQGLSNGKYLSATGSQNT